MIKKSHNFLSLFSQAFILNFGVAKMTPEQQTCFTANITAYFGSGGKLDPAAPPPPPVAEVNPQNVGDYCAAVIVQHKPSDDKLPPDECKRMYTDCTQQAKKQ